MSTGEASIQVSQGFVKGSDVLCEPDDQVNKCGHMFQGGGNMSKVFFSKIFIYLFGCAGSSFQHTGSLVVACGI